MFISNSVYCFIERKRSFIERNAKIKHKLFYNIKLL